MSPPSAFFSLSQDLTDAMNLARDAALATMEEKYPLGNYRRQGEVRRGTLSRSGEVPCSSVALAVGLTFQPPIERMTLSRGFWAL